MLPPFALERWFAEFEFVPGIRNLAASCPFMATTHELLEMEGPETTARYQELGLDYVENPGQMEQGWKPDLEQLSHLVDQKTRLIYLTHPITRQTRRSSLLVWLPLVATDSD